MKILKKLALIFFGLQFLILNSCAYHFGYEQRDLPGGYKQVAIPVFKNTTQQVGIEGLFTTELIRQFNRSKVAEVVDKSSAPITVEGKITKIKFIHMSTITPDESADLPIGSVLTVKYRVLLELAVAIRRNSDQKIVWTGAFNNEKVYSAPQVKRPVINSVNPLYNQSARMEVFEQMANDLMAEAHDRMTENF